MDNIKNKVFDPQFTKTWNKLFELYKNDVNKTNRINKVLNSFHKYEEFKFDDLEPVLENGVVTGYKATFQHTTYTVGNHDLLVFVNGDLQWVGEGYTESDHTSIILPKDIPTDSVINVIVYLKDITDEQNGVTIDGGYLTPVE